MASRRPPVRARLGPPDEAPARGPSSSRSSIGDAPVPHQQTRPSERFTVRHHSKGKDGCVPRSQPARRAAEGRQPGDRPPQLLSQAGYLAGADPYDFINVLLSGDNIQDSNNNNFSYFNDPTFNRRMTQ